MRFPHSRLAAVLVLSAAVAACSDSPTEPSPTFTVPFSITDLRAGTGAEARAGSGATVSYTLWLYSESAAENKGSRIEAGTFDFTVGAGNIIPGFSTGVTGMKVGGLRRLVVPPNLGYGAAGDGRTIPPNATLVFEVELLDVR